MFQKNCRNGPIIKRAVIKLNILTFPGEKVNAACIAPEGFDDFLPGHRGTASGWGTLESGGEQPLELKAVDVLIITNEECSQAAGYEDVDSSMLCAMEPNGGKDSCQGDSGGIDYSYNS